MQHLKFKNYGRSFLCYYIIIYSFSFRNSERPEIKDAAIDALYEKERENQVHHFTEETRVKHLSNWQ
jgi:hypothetical protein